MSDPIDPLAYVLRELPAAEVEEAERLLRDDERFRAEVDALRPVCERLESLPDEAWTAPDPPPLQLPAKDSSARDARPRRWSVPAGVPSWLRPAAIAAVACALLGAGLGAGLLIAEDSSESDGNGDVLELKPIASLDPAPWGEIAITGTGDDRAVQVTVGAMPPSSGDLYEFWLLDSAQGVLSLGTFSVPESGIADFEAPLPVDPGAYTYFDVSREPRDGDPAHSGESLLRGPT